ncbi:MAG: hypothetical protein WD267_13330 [Balneolales bacterium]
MNQRSKIDIALINLSQILDTFGSTLVIPLEPDDFELMELQTTSHIKSFQNSVDMFVNTIQDYLKEVYSTESMQPEDAINTLYENHILSVEAKKLLIDMIKDKNELVAICQSDYLATIRPALIKYHSVMQETIKKMSDNL